MSTNGVQQRSIPCLRNIRQLTSPDKPQGGREIVNWRRQAVHETWREERQVTARTRMRSMPELPRLSRDCPGRWRQMDPGRCFFPCLIKHFTLITGTVYSVRTYSTDSCSCLDGLEELHFKNLILAPSPSSSNKCYSLPVRIQGSASDHWQVPMYAGSLAHAPPDQGAPVVECRRPGAPSHFRGLGQDIINIASVPTSST